MIQTILLKSLSNAVTVQFLTFVKRGRDLANVFRLKNSQNLFTCYLGGSRFLSRARHANQHYAAKHDEKPANLLIHYSLAILAHRVPALLLLCYILRLCILSLSLSSSLLCGGLLLQPRISVCLIVLHFKSCQLVGFRC